MSFSPHSIRNICLLGHGGNGKTTLVESFLHMTGALDRMGKTADGNTVCDYDPEEIKRQISISAAVAPVEYNGCKINVLDTPGNFDFAGEVAECLSVADAGVLVCAAKGGLSVGTERAWKLLNERKLPRLVYISKMDEDNVDFNSAFDTLREHFGKNIAPLVVPIWDADKKVTGIVDVLHKRAYAPSNNKRVEIPVPEDKLPVIDEIYEQLMESVAETSEEFMEKYFGGEAFTYAEVVQGLRSGVREGSIVPVVCGSAYTGLGTLLLLDTIINLLPNPLEGIPHKGVNKDGESEEFILSNNAYSAAFVFKTVADQYGKFSFVKVLSDRISSDMTLVNATTGANEKIGRLYVMKGKKSEEVKELLCGDIGAIGKMDKVKTGDTLCDARKF
ncbi:MAG: GTP-binding protein, partial [Oscillospiraceae bacterium]|nr:GTP-binding protein [Oscillospiraceae bacterium]